MKVSSNNGATGHDIGTKGLDNIFNAAPQQLSFDDTKTKLLLLLELPCFSRKNNVIAAEMSAHVMIQFGFCDETKVNTHFS